MREQEKVMPRKIFSLQRGVGKNLRWPKMKKRPDWLASLAAASPSQSSDWSSSPLSDSKSFWDEPDSKQIESTESIFEQSQEPMFKEAPLNDVPASADLPDWLRGLDNEPQKPAKTTADNIPSWLRRKKKR